MSETQATISQWMNETFPGADPESPRKAIRALEEMVELCLAAGATPHEVQEACAKAIRGARGTHPDLQGWYESRLTEDKVPAEAADVAIVLYGVAHIKGFDLQAEIDRKMAINRARRWKANGDGTGYHVKNGGQS